jgi:hypothetical protein
LHKKIYKEQKQKVFCFGGALNMYELRERAVPDGILGQYFEWLWRMQNQPSRRILRILRSLLPAVSMFANNRLEVRSCNSISKGNGD